MRLSFSTNAFTHHSIFAAVEKIGAIGYDGVEILADAPHLYADSVTQADIEQVELIAHRAGMRIANINANTAMGFYGTAFWEPVFEPSLANPDDRHRQWRVEYSRKCIDMAHSLGCHNVSLTSGRMVPGVAPARSMELLKESLSDLLDYATQRDIRIGIEYEPGLLIERAEELAALIDEMGSPHLGANLDLGHSHVLGEDLETVLEALSPQIFHIHIEDIRQRKHYHLIPGSGDMDFEAIFNSLGRFSYDGFVTVELYTYPDMPEKAAQEAFRFLSGFVNRE